MATQRETVVGVFQDRETAGAAIRELWESGFKDEQVGYAIRDSAPETGTDLASHPGTEAAGGAATGALTGGLLGGLIGAAAALLVPGIGPVLAGGVLASALGGLAIGAAAGGLLGALTGMGVPEEEAAFYESEFNAGRAVVTVRAGGRHEEARSILTRHGARGMSDGSPHDGEAARVGTMTGAVQAETEDRQAALTSVGVERGRLPGTTDEIGSQAHIAQSSGNVPRDPAAEQLPEAPRQAVGR